MRSRDEPRSLAVTLAVAVVAGLLVAAVVLFAAPIGDSIGAGSEPAAKASPVGMSQDQRDRAIAIAKADPSFARLSAKGRLGVTDSGLWTSEDPNDVIGVVLEVKFDSPVVIDDTWPVQAYMNAAGGPPEKVQTRVHGSDLTGALVFVNFKTNSVDEMSPLETAEDVTVDAPAGVVPTKGEGD